METGTIQLEIVAPDHKVLEVAVEEVVLPGREGYLGVRPGHTPLLTSLGIGEVSYVQNGTAHYLALSQGVAEILPDRVSLLCKSAEMSEEIDVERAQASKARAEKDLAEADDASDQRFLRAEVKLKRAITRITVAGKRT